jgi:hypothetical protein
MPTGANDTSHARQTPGSRTSITADCCAELKVPLAVKKWRRRWQSFTSFAVVQLSW